MKKQFKLFALLALITVGLCACDTDEPANSGEGKEEKEGTVFIGNVNGFFYAVDAATGIKKWEFKAGDAIYSTATVVNGVVYFASWDKKLYALDAETGTKKWESKPGEVVLSQPFAAPLVSGGTLYYGGDNYFYALDAATGNKKWQFRDDEVYGWHASPTILNGVVYASIRGTGSRVGIYGLDAATGTRKWKAAKTLVTESSPAVVDGLLYAGFEYDGFNAFDLQTGATVWSVMTGFITQSSPTVSNNTAYINASDGSIWDTNASYFLLAIDAKTGSKKWQYKLEDNFLATYSSPIVSNGVVYTSGGSTIYAIDAASGAKKWEAQPDGPNADEGGPVVAMGMVFQGMGKNLYAYDAVTGVKKWEFKTDRGIGASPCVVTKSGVVYHGGISGMVQ